jgi:basic membrane protein A and related proteins
MQHRVSSLALICPDPVDRPHTARPSLRLPPLVLLISVIGAALAACGAATARTTTQFSQTKIGFIFVGTRDDLGYNQAAWEGSEAVARAFPDHQVLRVENVPETPITVPEAALEGLIKQGARILFATSFGHLAAAYAVARRHPDVIVLHEGGVEPLPHLPNFGTYWGTVYEPVYQAGIAAGAATRTGQLGFVAAFRIPATYLNVDAFTLGARSVNPKVTTHVILTGSWCDPARQASAAQRLLADHVDVMTQHQDCTRTVLAAADQAGIASIGYHEDGSEAAPRGWLVGTVWNWPPLFIDIVHTIVAGHFAGSRYQGDYRGGYRTGNNPFVLTEFSPAVSASTAAAIAAAGARFAGGHSPFDGPITDESGRVRIVAGVTPSVAELDQLDWFVPGVRVEGDAS